MRFNGLLLKDFDPLSVDITEIQNIVDEVKKSIHLICNYLKS